MKFSFAILTWNRKAFIEKCLTSLLESVKEQDGVEILVMDNGSTDGTREHLQQFESDGRFRIFTLDRNYGLDAYKKLFARARGEYVVVVDDDVLEFPNAITTIFDTYMTEFSDFGFLALNVVQNEHTNGAKPPDDHYTVVERDGKVVLEGPTGGWCACFRRKDFRKIRFLFNLKNLDMSTSEDGTLAHLFRKWLRLKSGLINDHRCFHASGPYYSAKYGFVDRDIEKYKDAGLDNFVEEYERYR